MSLNSVEEIIEDLRNGKMVILMDDEDRENEGDLIMAASEVRPEDINFMASHGRGLICLTLTRERCKQLKLPLMVNDNEAQFSTNFTVSIEAAEGVTTGISAYDRAHTVRTAVTPSASPKDIVQPGHIFPLMAQSGGVLARAGHTEAGCDLARLAGLEPAAVIVEILNEDGSMARRPDLEIYAKKHNLKMGTIADLIHYRIENEKSVERIAESEVMTEFGEFHLVAFEDSFDHDLHFAFVRGEIDPEDTTLVRVHMKNVLGDLINTPMEGMSVPLRSALKCIADEGKGIVVVLRRPESNRDIVDRLKNYSEHYKEEMHREEGGDLRTYGIGAQILTDLGVRRMRVLGSARKIHAIKGFDLEVVEYVHC
ncbi:MAG: 3,4-dihydroxy-2-butanone-4-phosphate synthase [Gammaproteobacteria bacterium]|nr:3,4-dihydroxy-2-butanone-4-phosphate synthase [Gammaproteobacteria bacterium]